MTTGSQWQPLRQGRWLVRRREQAPALQNAVILRSKATKDPLRKNIRTIEGDSSLRSE